MLQAFVACGWGISRIGYVMICFGLANTIAAAVASALAKLIGRNKILALTLVLHAALLIYMHEWIAVPNDMVAFCSMAALWGLLDGTWLVIINCRHKHTNYSSPIITTLISIVFFFAAYYGILFRGQEEAAFSNFRLFESCGSVITYTVSPMLCAAAKIKAIFSFMMIGIIG